MSVRYITTPAGVQPIFALIYRSLAIRFYRWARAEIDPMHPDLPKIVVRVNQLENGNV